MIATPHRRAPREPRPLAPHGARRSYPPPNVGQSDILGGITGYVGRNVGITDISGGITWRRAAGETRGVRGSG